MVILVCDDDKADLKLFRSNVQRSILAESELIEVDSVESFEAILSENGQRIDIIFLDNNMPGRSGFEWLSILRKKNLAPIVMLTGSGDEITAAQAIKAGAADYLPKQRLDPFELVKTINNALERWELEKERNALLGIAAHELRNPLTTILGFSYLLKSEDFNESDKKEIYEIITERSEYLLNMINKLLDITRIDLGTIPLEISVLDFVGFIRKVVHNFKIQTERKQVTIELKTDSESIYLRFDPQRMDEVISNLIDNAIKYSHIGGTIILEVNTTTNNVVFTVIDNGPGIKESELQYLFKLFSNVKVSSRATKGEKSTGIGLAICRKIVHLHGGEIEVKSIFGEGSIFIIKLPRS